MEVELRRLDVARLGGVIEHGEGVIIDELEQIGWSVPVGSTAASRRGGGIGLRVSAAGAFDLAGPFDSGCGITWQGCGSGSFELLGSGDGRLLGRGDGRELHDGGPAVEQADGLGHGDLWLGTTTAAASARVDQMLRVIREILVRANPSTVPISAFVGCW